MKISSPTSMITKVQTASKACCLVLCPVWKFDAIHKANYLETSLRKKSVQRLNKQLQGELKHL